MVSDDFAPEPTDCFDQYVRILSALSRPGVDPDAVLAEFGLSEAEWDALEESCEARLNSDEVDDEKTVEYLGRLAQGLCSASTQQQEPNIDFDTWLAVVRACRTGAQFEAQLALRRFELSEFLAAQAYWIQRMAKEPELLARYRRNG